jgi:glycosyltransferase involved in cell wall biosynthesis
MPTNFENGATPGRRLHVMVLMAMTEQRGGGEKMLLHFLQQVPKNEVRLTVVFFGEGSLVGAARAVEGIKVEVVPTGRLRHLHRYVQAVRALCQMVDARDVDLIFSWTGKPHLYGGMVSLLAGVPAAWYQLGIPEGRHLSWIDQVANLLPTAGVVTLSKQAKQAQRRLWPRREVALVYPCFDAETFDPARLPSPAAAREQLGLPAGVPIVGMVGRLQEWKGIHTLVRAMPQILRSYPETQAIIVGGAHDLEPAYPARLHSLIAEHGLEEHVHLVGYHANVPTWMQAMDVFVHASDAEPFGIVIIEALALGKPVIAGATGGPQEILEDGRTGHLVPFEAHGQLAERVIDLLQHPEKRSVLASAGRRVADAYHPARYARRLLRSIRAFAGESPITYASSTKAAQGANRR